MSDGQDRETEVQDIIRMARARNMAEALIRVQNLLKNRSQRTIDNSKKNPTPKKARAALEAAQDFRYLVEALDLIINLTNENEVLRQTVNVLSEKCSLIEAPTPEKKKSMN
jgi:hypothetical protein